MVEKESKLWEKEKRGREQIKHTYPPSMGEINIRHYATIRKKGNEFSYVGRFTVNEKRTWRDGRGALDREKRHGRNGGESKS